MTKSTTSPPPVSEYESPRVNTWKIGTLVYTRRAIVFLFVWLLAGDFCFSVVEQIIPTLLPLDLRGHGASNAIIGLIVGTIPSAMSTIFTPVIAFRSDRHRGRFGRRIPYLLWTAPLIAIFLVVTGFSNRIGGWLHAHVWLLNHMSPSATIIWTIAVASVLFQFFNIFALSIFYYLFRDIVPVEFMGRFVGFFRVVGSVALFLYNRYVFGLSTVYRDQIYIGAAVMYFLAFTLMCWRVKEGEYPPPPQVDKKHWFGGVITYFRECFRDIKMVMLFSATAFYAAGVAAINTFLVFFALSLGLTRDDYGKLNGWAWLIPAAVSIPMGYLVDKLTPIRLTLFGMSVMVLAALSGFIGIYGPRVLFSVMLIYILGKAIYEVSMLPLLMRILPGDRFGQFASANAMCSAVGYMVGSSGAGWFLDAVGHYRFVYLWAAVFIGVATLLLTGLHVAQRRDSELVSPL